MNEKGFIKLHRKTLENPIVMKDSSHLSIWIYLLLSATHKEMSVVFKGEKIILQPGQLITGTLSIAKKLKIDKMKVQRTLNEFESDKQIEQQTSNKNRLITILNWEEYQKFDKQNDKQLINNRETTDKQLITNKNVKNVRNIYNTTTTTDFSEEKNLFDFLQENGFVLSPLHYEEVSKWEDNELTRYAIKQAVLNNKYNVKYISTILGSYDKENITTIEQAKEREEAFLKKQQNYYKNKYQVKEKKSATDVLDEWLKGKEENESKRSL